MALEWLRNWLIIFLCDDDQMERVKFEIQEKRKRQARTIVEAIEHGLAKRLRVKDEERERIGKINHALEERVKSLSIENQIWRDLAQSNEATANNLRANLEEVLAQVKDITGAGLANCDDDAQSCCGSSSGEETVRRTVVAKGRMCRSCGEEESCVLVLPCRHLCLCGVCGSSVHTCPICRSPKNASVHVNMSPWPPVYGNYLLSFFFVNGSFYFFSLKQLIVRKFVEYIFLDKSFMRRNLCHKERENPHCFLDIYLIFLHFISQ